MWRIDKFPVWENIKGGGEGGGGRENINIYSPAIKNFVSTCQVDETGFLSLLLSLHSIPPFSPSLTLSDPTHVLICLQLVPSMWTEDDAPAL